ncbi:hypothetical protein DAEQUDRAFT_32319 [Daedalea quercina L-15889]|uniref:Uncharacterized protein n=1 Tax=Daedalea quercina L-15889 TaxID=1314783 RepID=A0A165SQW6_9APHY|nr:hypothetical protein DAEQUDRAFT_32319 [Daedalea quercina L-15889]
MSSLHASAIFSLPSLSSPVSRLPPCPRKGTLNRRHSRVISSLSSLGHVGEVSPSHARITLPVAKLCARYVWWVVSAPFLLHDCAVAGASDGQRRLASGQRPCVFTGNQGQPDTLIA